MFPGIIFINLVNKGILIMGKIIPISRASKISKKGDLLIERIIKKGEKSRRRVAITGGLSFLKYPTFANGVPIIIPIGTDMLKIVYRKGLDFKTILNRPDE